MIHDIDNDLRGAEHTLNHWSRKYPDIARRAGNAKIAYELAAAEVKKNLQDSLPEGGKLPTIPFLEGEITRCCQKELTEKIAAETELDIAKNLIGIAETTLTSIQTRAKLTQIELGLSR